MLPAWGLSLMAPFGAPAVWAFCAADRQTNDMTHAINIATNTYFFIIYPPKNLVILVEVDSARSGCLGSRWDTQGSQLGVTKPLTKYVCERFFPHNRSEEHTSELQSRQYLV